MSASTTEPAAPAGAPAGAQPGVVPLPPPPPADKPAKKPATPAYLTTPLGLALQEAGLPTYARLFDEAGYTSLPELGEDEAAAKAAITAIVYENKPGVIARVLAMWRTATAKPAEAPTRTPQPLPTLPKGTTLDLTQPTVELDGVVYAIPSALSTTKSDKDYGPTDWMILAKRTKLCFGIDLDSAFGSTGDDSARAARPALVWSVPAGDDYIDSEKRSVVTSTLSYTSNASNLVHNRIMGGSLSISAPFVSAAAAAGREEAQASAQVHKRLYMTGLWRYLQATINLPSCTAASPVFVAEVQQAVDLPADQRFTALRRVFERYGHAASNTVTMGAQLYFQSERNTSGQVNENSVKTTVQAAVSAKFMGVGAEASANFADGEGNKVAAEDIAESTTFTCVGGDTTLGSNPKDWAATAKDPNSWAIIGRNGLVPLVDWLEPALKAKVMDAWNAGLRTVWGTTPPQGFVTPDLDGQQFTISSIPPVTRVAGRDAVAWRTTKGVNSVDPPYVAAMSATLLADPIEHNLAWRLVYTGKTTAANGRGKPMYWLVGQKPGGQPEFVAAAKPHPDYGQYRTALAPYYLVLLPASEMITNGRTPEVSPASWTLDRTDPSGYFGASYTSAYQFVHVQSGNTVGPLQWNDSGSLIHPAYAPRCWIGVGGSANQIDDQHTWICTPVTA